MKNSLLMSALSASMESLENVDETIEEMAADQHSESPVSEGQLTDEIDQVEGDIELIDQAEAMVEGDNVSLEQLAHARGIVDSIGVRYGAAKSLVSMESADDQRLDKDLLLEDIRTYRAGLESHIIASMEGFFLGANNLKDIGANIESMRQTIAILKSNDRDRIEKIRFGNLKLFLKVGGSLPQDIARAVKDVSGGLELALKHSDSTLAVAQRAAEIAIKTNWSDADAADKARDQIKALKLNLDDISSDLNGFPMFGNRSFGVKVKGTAGDLGEWDKSYSFGSGTPNAGMLRTALQAVGYLNLLALNVVGAALFLVIATNAGNGKSTERQVSIKDLADGFGEYAKSAEKIYNQRGAAIKRSTVHTKLMTDLKNVSGLPRDVRKAIARASSFGWAISNSVYDVVAHSVYALAEAGERVTKR